MNVKTSQITSTRLFVQKPVRLTRKTISAPLSWESLVTSGFPTHTASNVDSVSMSSSKIWYIETMTNSPGWIYACGTNWWKCNLWSVILLLSQNCVSFGISKMRHAFLAQCQSLLWSKPSTVLRVYLIEAWPKWLHFCRRHVQCIFLHYKFVFWMTFHWSLFLRVQLKNKWKFVIGCRRTDSNPLHDSMIDRYTYPRASMS